MEPVLLRPVHSISQRQRQKGTVIYLDACVCVIPAPESINQTVQMPQNGNTFHASHDSTIKLKLKLLSTQGRVTVRLECCETPAAWLLCAIVCLDNNEGKALSDRIPSGCNFWSISQGKETHSRNRRNKRTLQSVSRSIFSVVLHVID